MESRASLAGYAAKKRLENRYYIYRVVSVVAALSGVPSSGYLFGTRGEKATPKMAVCTREKGSVDVTRSLVMLLADCRVMDRRMRKGGYSVTILKRNILILVVVTAIFAQVAGLCRISEVLLMMVFNRK